MENKTAVAVVEAAAVAEAAAVVEAAAVAEPRPALLPQKGPGQRLNVQQQQQHRRHWTRMRCWLLPSRFP